MKKSNFLSKHKILKMKEFKLKHLKFLKFKIFQNFKFLHPNTLLGYVWQRGMQIDESERDERVENKVDW